MALLTASSGAVTNIVLNLVFIPKMGANGAAIATVCAFLMVFITRGANTRKYVKMNFQLPTMIVETVILIVQSALILWLKSGVVLYVIEALLFALMFLVNIRQVKELLDLIFAKFLKKKKQ